MYSWALPKNVTSNWVSPCCICVMGGHRDSQYCGWIMVTIEEHFTQNGHQSTEMEQLLVNFLEVLKAEASHDPRSRVKLLLSELTTNNYSLVITSPGSGNPHNPSIACNYFLHSICTNLNLQFSTVTSWPGARLNTNKHRLYRLYVQQKSLSSVWGNEIIRAGSELVTITQK